MREVVRYAGSRNAFARVQPGMDPELRDALIESGHDPDDPSVLQRLADVDRGLAILRKRWHLTQTQTPPTP
ncbi:hypothetical protein [Nocardia sp. NPDC060249]|uniref:hypothetical protein n=1 Tax=Nocardia sp. NPDC060249 TaxID=3347082 RepID=UPI00365BACBA